MTLHLKYLVKGMILSNFFRYLLLLLGFSFPNIQKNISGKTEPMVITQKKGNFSYDLVFDVRCLGYFFLK